MTRRWWGIVGLLLAVVPLCLAGCAGGGAYQEVGYGGSYLTDVPPSFYDNDPTMREWYTAPYWNPDASP